MSQDVIRTLAGRCRLGIGCADITPPPDAYHRNWGAALHDAAEGIHRPLRATAMLLQGLEDGPEQLLVALDLGWLRAREMERLLEQVSAGTGVALERLSVVFSHTHSAVNLDLSRIDEPGGDHITPFLERLPGDIVEAAEKARSAVRPVDLTFARGCCGLAMHRDYRDEERQVFVCGPNPGGPADDAVWVMRAADLSGETLAYLVNYACHPTTLAWENRLISPDYIGGMRELVEETTGVPCMYLLGASGDLGPRDGFTGDTVVADRNGRRLGYAALEAIESMPQPGTEMRYVEPVISGATLGIWEHRPFAPERLEAVQTFRFAQLQIDLPFKEMKSREELEADLEMWREKEDAARREEHTLDVRDCRARIERVRRALGRLEGLPPSGRATYCPQLWQLGEGVLVAVGGEPYNLFQRSLRERFPDVPILIAELSNRPHSYILPVDQCGRGHYQDEISTLAPGSLERIIDVIGAQLREWGLG